MFFQDSRASPGASERPTALMEAAAINAQPPFRCRLFADRERALAFRREFGDWLQAVGLGGQAAFETRLACWEAVMNAIEHPLTPTSPVVDVTAAVEEENLIVTVRDY